MYRAALFAVDEAYKTACEGKEAKEVTKEINAKWKDLSAEDKKVSRADARPCI